MMVSACGGCPEENYEQTADERIDVDKAVEEGGHDPTGGRGMKSEKRGAEGWEDGKVEEALNSAV